MKFLERLCNFTAALAFEFDIDWDEDYEEDSPCIEPSKNKIKRNEIPLGAYLSKLPLAGLGSLAFLIR